MIPRSPRARGVLLLLLGCAAGFTAGWIVRSDPLPYGGYGRMSSTGRPCADRGRVVGEIEGVADALSLSGQAREGRQTVVFDRIGRAGELWVAETPLDDEVEAFATRFQVEWSDSGGWRVSDCAYRIRRRL